MKKSNVLHTDDRVGASHLVLGLACASLASACSGYYPLGETGEAGQFLGAAGSVATGEAAARVAGSLAPPDVTMSANAANNPESVASVGDLDGDGRDEMAVGSFDPTTLTQYVHLRYGGPRPLDGQEAFAFEQSGARLTIPNGDQNTLRPLGAFAAGDVDGDGYGDMLVFTVDCDTTLADEGAYLVYGGPERLEGTSTLPSLATRFVPPAREASEPETRGTNCRLPELTSPGDIDGDGFDDVLLVRAPQDSQTDGSVVAGTGEGIYVFYGSAQRFSGDVPFTASDALIATSERLAAFSLGDVNGDGVADLLLSPSWFIPTPTGSFLLEGREERLSGSVDLVASTIALEGALVPTGIHSHGDLDGDGLDDVLLQDADQALRLFYGAPGLFASGVEFAEADATVFAGAVRSVYPVGDRDGDGDAELLDQFITADDFELRTTWSNIAFADGSGERLTGEVGFPESEIDAQSPNGRFPQDLTEDRKGGRALQAAIPAGDLDGDGADDLFTTSYIFNIEDDGIRLADLQLHIHYGTPALTPLR